MEDDDPFDWEAAVAEIDEACSRSQNNRVKGSTGVHASGHQTGAHHPRFIGENSSSSRLSQLSNFGQVASGKAQQKSLLSYLKVVEPKPVVLEATRTEFEEGCRTEPAGVDIDPATATTWIYPANIPCRQYQFAITKTALFTNTIVSLPTGLGKTLIAAVVMYNYYRWFPTGKIVFTAPSRPLVLQQIEACHNIMGISQEMTIDMTGQMSPPQRAEHWQNRRVFFVTPQCLEKDIQSGACPVREMVCLVVDEAHRATGNFSYCIVVRELLAANVKLRTLALTATPGSKQATIQAVVDNLQMSCLEYRDENDTDVCQYTHNRKLEVIQVAMNAEATTIKDKFLDILSPLIDNLIKLGVFYSRELARLSPFEFITARDKFRQAPPQALGQHQYREVESHFSKAITLYYIFKLLHSHGIRPALEMLQTKLHQGALRVLAKNDRLLQIKKLMQESVGHGAPSPKLVKIEEIILLHFREHNPLTTRVIIFTNYRESVKDIMEALQKLHVVKAMEFIGQSSGKASKGQTQKMQQAVLQKFRAGGYNTIVATSIAEEGLDIMEVDLVICFDANVSPLRMIQRMGRTGRKRDGRVALVLASEGAEMQGYIRKQAKNKALGKHMQHGGVNSFNFHPSPRMVPHVFRPEVQMTEMSIEQYVPRGKKTHPASSATFDPGVHELSEEEKAILQRYAVPPHLEAWKPSLIAFPRYQLLPTPVCAVKHSSRTTSMLIDVLQGLQEPAFAPAGTGNLPNQFELSSLDDVLLSSRDKNVDPPTMAGKDQASGADESMKEIHYLDGRSNGEDNEDSDSPYVVPEGEVLGQGLNFLDKGPAIGLKGATHKPHAADIQADGFALDKAQISEEPAGNLATIISHQLLFSTRIVFTNSAGELKIASPPEWPPARIRTSFDHQNRFSSQILLPKQIPESCVTALPWLEERTSFRNPDEARIARAVTNVSSIPSSVTKVPEKLLGGGEYETVALKKLPQIDVSNSTETTPMKSFAEESEEFIAATPEDKLPQTATVDCPRVTQARFISPRLDPRPQAVLCLSPTTETPVISKQLVTPMYTSKCWPPLPPGSSLGTPVTSTSECIDDNSRKVMQFLDKISFGQRGTPENLGTARSGDVAFRAGSSRFIHPHEGLQSPAKPKMLDFGDSVVATENNLNSASIWEGDGKTLLSSDLPSPQVRVHNQYHQRLQEQLPNKQANENGFESVDGQQKTSHGLKQGAEIQVLSGEVVPSRERPQRKFKRLKKARELVLSTPSASASKRRLGHDRCSESKTIQLERPSKLGKVMRKFTVQPYIDEEAEVSTDEEISTEDDEDDDSLDDDATPDGFIDTCNTQHLRSGSLDMMAVYRRSLLSQSPLVGGLTTPISTSSDTLVSATGGSDSNQSVGLSSRSNVPYSGPGPVFIASSCHVGSHSTHEFKCPGGKDSSSKKVQMCATPTSAVQDQNADIGNGRRLEIRKRKLSFQLQEDENLFAGLDLDALEEEASHQARARATQFTCSIAPIPSFDLGIDS